MPCPLLIFDQSDYLMQVVDINSNTEWQTVQIQISWLLKKPTDLDLHCLQRQCISLFSRTRVKNECIQGRCVIELLPARTEKFYHVYNIFQHAHRRTYDISGIQNYEDSGIMMLPFDYTKQKYLADEVPAMIGGREMDCSLGPYCGMPFIIPVIAMLHPK